MEAATIGRLIQMSSKDPNYDDFVSSLPEERRWTFDGNADPYDDDHERVIYQALQGLGYEPLHHAWEYPRYELPDGRLVRGFRPDYTFDVWVEGLDREIEIQIEVTNARKRAGHHKVSRIKRIGLQYGIAVFLANRQIVQEVRQDPEILGIYLDYFIEDVIEAGVEPTRLAVAA